MEPLDLLVRLVVLPGGVCAVAALLAWVVAKRAPNASEAIRALGLAAGFCASLHASDVRPGLPLAPSDDLWTWVLWFAPAGWLIGALESFAPLPRPARAAMRWAVGSLAAWLLLAPMVPHAIPSAEAWARSVGVGAVVALLWTALAREARPDRKLSLGAPVLVAVVGAAVVLVALGHSLVMGKAAGSLATCIGATAVLSLRRPVATIPAAAAPVVVLPFAGLLVAAHATLNYADTVNFPWPAGLLLLVAGFAVLVRRSPVAVACAAAATGLAALAAWQLSTAAPPAYY